MDKDQERSQREEEEKIKEGGVSCCVVLRVMYVSCYHVFGTHL